MHENICTCQYRCTNWFGVLAFTHSLRYRAIISCGQTLLNQGTLQVMTTLTENRVCIAIHYVAYSPTSFVEKLWAYNITNFLWSPDQNLWSVPKPITACTAWQPASYSVNINSTYKSCLVCSYILICSYVPFVE